MATGLIALLDDVAALAKIAAASLDDAAPLAAKAGAKATGIVIDDAAVTPRYVVGFAAERELPIIGKIAAGSIKNKLLFILPAALLLSLFAPWLITPILMIGGAYLCLEGYHKVLDTIRPHEEHVEEAVSAAQTPQELEDEKVASAIRTDIILSAEIMAIALAAVAASPLWLQAAILFVVAIGMTALVYGVVAIIVKMDDWGAALARRADAASQAVGRAIVLGMPSFLKALSFIGMIAMLWVGGGILVHGLAVLGYPAVEHAIHSWGEAVAPPAPVLGGFVIWAVGAAVAAVIGLVVGALVDPVAKHVIAPAIKAVAPRRKAAA